MFRQLLQDTFSPVFEAWSLTNSEKDLGIVWKSAHGRSLENQTPHDLPRANFSRQLLRLYHCFPQTTTCGTQEYMEFKLFYSSNPFNSSWETKYPGCGPLRFCCPTCGSLQKRVHSEIGRCQSFWELRMWGRTAVHFFWEYVQFFYFWTQNRKKNTFLKILAQFDKIP